MSFSEIFSIADIRKNIKNISKSSGVYKHYINKSGLEYLEGVYPQTKEIAIDGTEIYLLYVGKSKNLHNRYKWHLGITNSSHKSILGKWLSTLRLSYMANHKDIICLSEQEKLNKFMDEYTYTQYMITEDYHNVEEELIRENDLPLNVQGNTHIFVSTNKRRRDSINNKYQSKYANNDSPIKKIISTKLSDEELLKYAYEAKDNSIQNKSQFVKWFRNVKNKSASESRLNSAWVESKII